MFPAILPHNLLSWMLQSIVIALVAALLPIVFRVRHPRTQLVYCHAALALCLLLPLVEPWRHPVAGASSGSWGISWRWLPGILAAGVVLQLCWMSGGLWRIRRYRIAATPLYPVPEAMQAASAITHANALFCVSEEAAGPMMLGWLAPVVLLPASFLALSEEAQCGIACHELLHVRRGDWLVTLIEEFAGALLWFNPGIWLLLSEARLAREQLVDAESVRLTASPEPYIDALLAIARGHSWSDLAPAPTFLRRSHLTQRMQSLLSETPASGRRLIGSYCSIVAILACTVWFACTAFPILGQPILGQTILGQTPPGQPSSVATRANMVAGLRPPAAPSSNEPAERGLRVPATSARGVAVRAGDGDAPVTVVPVIDPYEPVSGGVQIESISLERAPALGMLARAREGAVRHAPGMPPFRFTVSFTASGNVLNTGHGELAETWMTGQKWKWTASLGSVSHAQMLFRGQLLEDSHVAVIPMRAHMLRNEILWATRWLARDEKIRSAKILWQGKPATCILSSQGLDGDPQTQGRQWDEEEFCIDDASGVLVVHSIAPGTYAQFVYDANLQFHGRPMPNRIQIYVAGLLAVDASFNITDTTAADDSSLYPTPGMTGSPPLLGLGVAVRARVNVPGAQPADASQPVIVHAEIDGDGNVVETEMSATANPGLVPAALEHVGKMTFGHTGTERQGYFEVRFVPATQ